MRRVARAYFGTRGRRGAATGECENNDGRADRAASLADGRGRVDRGGASSRDQARIAFERMESFLAHEELDGMVTLRHLELRFEGPEGMCKLRVVPSDGPRTHGHGLSCTLYVGDEVWAWAQRADLLTAFTTGLVKRPDSSC